MAMKKTEPKRHSSSAVGRAGRAATPEQVEAKQKAAAAKAAKTKASSGFGDKRDHRAVVGKSGQIDREKFDVLLVYPTEEEGKAKDYDKVMALRPVERGGGGYTEVPEMSDPEIGMSFLVRDRAVRLKQDVKRAEKCAKLVQGVAADGAGVTDAALVTIRQNEAMFNGVELPTQNDTVSRSGVDKLMDAGESND